ncbi:MAG: T9SS type A sorting domain-containing protein, partial [Flammeovirgaceae bacterium]
CRKAYSFRIVSINKVGISDYSNVVSVQPFSLPTPKITPSKLSACKGEKISLEAPQGFAEYFWNIGESSQKIQVSNTGEFAAKVKDNLGCESNWSEKTKVTFYDYPDSLITAKPDEIVYVGTAESFKWFLNGKVISGETKNKIKPIESGVYRVEASAKGCTTSSNKINFIVTGIESLDLSVNVYPNPTLGNVTISFGKLLNMHVRLKLFDLSGKQVFQCDKSEFQETIIVESLNLKSGLYLLQLDFDGGVIREKVIVE